MNYREYVVNLELKEILQLIEDYQKFEKDGSIGLVTEWHGLLNMRGNNDVA